MKAGGYWQEVVDEATTRQQRWETTNNKSMWQMVMASTKRAKMAREMVMAMRVLVDKDNKGGTGHGIGNEGGVR